MPCVPAPPSSPRRRSNSSVCGICGVAFASRSADADSRVRAMTAAMRHRGPDEEAFLAGDARAPGLALGMRRLSIIDLAGGHQPAWNETKDVAVILNGELYNYRDLRERLSLCGHRFTTQSDTEILVHAWEEWGEDSLTELRGMFAFACLIFASAMRRRQFFSWRVTRWASSHFITRRRRRVLPSLRRFERYSPLARYPNICLRMPSPLISFLAASRSQ